MSHPWNPNPTIIGFDVETGSPVDLRKHGLDVYVNHPATRAWCFAWDDPSRKMIRNWYPGLGACPAIWSFAAHINDPRYAFAGWNVMFDAMVWNVIIAPRYNLDPIPLWQLRDTMAEAQAMGFPGGLDNAAQALRLPIQKDTQGRRLMLKMAKPRRLNPDGSYEWWDDHQNQLDLLTYCMQDVAVEKAIREKVFPLSGDEHMHWQRTQIMNIRGVAVDLGLARSASKIVKDRVRELDQIVRRRTNGAVTATTQVSRLRQWVCEAQCLEDHELPTLDKNDIDKLLADKGLFPNVREVLNARREAGRASTSKINAMLDRVGDDGRLRWMFRFNGAGSTGRWSSQGVQLQNLYRKLIANYPQSLEVIRSGDIKAVRLFFGDNVMETIASCLRPMLMAESGKSFLAMDFSSIEAIITATLAHDHSKLQVFRDGRDVYQYTGVQMFGGNETDITGDIRQASKVCELSLGFGGGPGALLKMAENYGIDDWSSDYAGELVSAWREANPRTVRLWNVLEITAKQAITNGPKAEPLKVACGLDLRYWMGSHHLWLRLPSGRKICYPWARIENKPVPWDPTELRPTIVYEGPDPYTRKWVNRRAWRGILVENPVQAIGADLMRHALEKMELEGLDAVLTTHDEGVAEVVDRPGLSDLLKACFETPPAWAGNMPLKAEGWTDTRYRK